MADVAVVKEMLIGWDPIGVKPGSAEDGFGRDEYDSYAPHIVSLLAQGSSLEQLRNHLSGCRTVAMGLPPNVPADSRFAAELVNWWERSR
jgi:hypothetical protein